MRERIVKLENVIKFLCVALLVINFSCASNEVDVEEQTVKVTINPLTETNLKTSTIDVERNNTPACVRELFIKAERQGDIRTVEQGFRFTNPTLWWGLSDPSADNDHTTTMIVYNDLEMNVWAGHTKWTAYTTSFVEDWYTDPMGSEADGVSSGGSTLEFIHNAPVNSTGTERIVEALRTIPPYAEYTTDAPVFSFVNLTEPNESINLNMVTNHSRIIVTFEFEEGNTGYTADISFDSFNSDGSHLYSKAPNRILTYENPVWYYWSNDDAEGGRYMNSLITVNHMEDPINGSQPFSLHDLCGGKNYLKSGKDIWLKVTIIGSTLKTDIKEFNITYNWDELNLNQDI